MECDVCYRPMYGSTQAFVSERGAGSGDLQRYLRTLPLNEWHTLNLCKDHLYEMVGVAEEVMDSPELWHPNQQHPWIIGGGSKVGA
jgi:hypothetical protein